MIRNSLWNAMGLIIPSLFAIPAMSVMARVLGVEKFGIFMLTFSALGYAGIFDGGLTRAVIRSIAMNEDDEVANREVLGTASYSVLAMGTVGAALVYVGASHCRPLERLNGSIGRNDRALCRGARHPVYLLSLVWFAYLEGKQRFVKLSVLKTVSGIVLTILPAAAVLIKPDLATALGALLLARLVTLVMAYRPCRTGLGAGVFHFRRATLRDLFRFGGWIAVSNIVSPIMGYVDRFILSNLLGAARVAFYAAPAEVVARMAVIPGAVSRTIFPMFSRQQSTSGGTARTASRGLLLICTAVAIPIFIGAEWLLDLWLGPPYGQESATLLRILLVGFVFNAVSQVPYSRIQALGHSRVTATLHLIELLPYLALLAILVREYGLIGAAIAWTVRMFADFLALQVLARRLVN
jgi:O-antigen/teichoic acid export membrane protein